MIDLLLQSVNITENREGYLKVYAPGHRLALKSGDVYVSNLIVDSVIGKAFDPKKGHVVHHVDEDPANNKNSNLVVCQSREYHALLHSRLQAIRETGNANYRKCRYCGEWEDMSKLSCETKPTKFAHRQCKAERERKRRQRQWLKGD